MRLRLYAAASHSYSCGQKKGAHSPLRRMERVYRRLRGTRQGLPLRLTSGMLAEAIRASLVVIEAGDLALEKCDRQPFLRPVHLACLATGRSAPRPPPRSSGSQSPPAPRGAHALTPRTVARLRRLCLLPYELTQARSSLQGSRQGPPVPSVQMVFCVREDPCCVSLSCHAAIPQFGAALHQQDASGDNGFVCILTRCPRRPFLKD